MEVLNTSVYLGPSLYARFPVIRFTLALGALEEWPSARLGEDFIHGLLTRLPGLSPTGGTISTSVRICLMSGTPQRSDGRTSLPRCLTTTISFRTGSGPGLWTPVDAG